MVRPGILDLGELTVEQYVNLLKEASLNDGSNPAVLGWSKNNNRYTLKLKMVDQTAKLTFVHDLSAQSKGAISLLLPVEIASEKADALIFTTLLLGQ